MYNKKVLSTAKKELNKAKAPKKPKDMITDPMGQWKYPGLDTRIPGNGSKDINITMDGVYKPLLAIADTGEKKKLYPGENHTFRGAKYVDEFPEAKRGGNKKRKTKSLSGTNKLFQKNALFKNYKNREFDPNVDYFQEGGMKTVKSKDGTVTNIVKKKDGTKLMQVKTKDGRYYEKELKDWEYDKYTLGKSKDISINPQKWGLNDYSDYSSYNSAFRNARESKEDEFTYKGERYNTKLIPKKDSDLYWEGKEFVKDYYKNQPYTRKIDSDLSGYDITNNYVKNKYKATWHDVFEKQKKLENKLGSFEKAINDPEWIKLDNLLMQISKEERSILKNENADYTNYLNKIKEEEAANQRKQRLNDLDKPSYFSITSQKPKDMRADGYWNKAKNKTFMRTNTEPGKLNTTYVHELSHKADDIIDVMNTVPEINLKKLNNSPLSQSMTQETYNYVSDPSEIEARKISTLYFLKKHKIPWKSGQINENTIDKLYDYYSEDKLPYDIKQLLELYSGQQEDLLKYLNGDFSYKTAHDFQDGGVSIGLNSFVDRDREGNTIPMVIPSVNYSKGNFSTDISTNVPAEHPGEYEKNINLGVGYYKPLGKRGKYGNLGIQGDASISNDPYYNVGLEYTTPYDKRLGLNFKASTSSLKDLKNNLNASVGLTYRFQDGGFKTKLSEEEEKEFQKFYETLPENLKSDDSTYDIRGYWDGSGRPSEFDYSQPKEDDGYYHAFSINPKTGEYLKSPAHPTFQLAIEEDKKMGYRPTFNIRTGRWESEEVSPEYANGGDINLELTQDEIDEYVKGGYIVEDISVPELTKAQDGIIEISDPEEFAYREKKYNDSLNAYNYGQKKLEKRNQLNKKYNIKENPANKFPASDKNTLVQKIVQKRTIYDVAPTDVLFTDGFHSYYSGVNGKKNKDPNLLISMTNEESGVPIHADSQDYKDLTSPVPFYKKPTQKPVKKNKYPTGYQPYSLYGKVLDPERYGYGESNDGKPIQLAQHMDAFAKELQMEKYKKSGKYPWVKQDGGLIEAQTGKTVEISDPKEFAYRNQKYKDSLDLYNYSNKQREDKIKRFGKDAIGIYDEYIKEKAREYLKQQLETYGDLAHDSKDKYGKLLTKIQKRSKILPIGMSYNVEDYDFIFKKPKQKVTLKKKKEPVQNIIVEKPIVQKEKPSVQETLYPQGYQPYSLYGRLLDPEVYGYGESINNKPVELAQGADMMLKKMQMEKYKKSGKYPWSKQNGGLIEAQTGGFKPIPLPLDKTKSETTQMVSLPARQAIQHIKNKPGADKAKKKEKKEIQKFKKQLWKEYEKLPLSEKVSDRIGAFFVDPAGMTARALTGEQAYLPGMGKGLLNDEHPEIRDKYLKELGYTKGEFDASDLQNMINPFYWASSLVDNVEKGNYGEAGLEAVLMGLPHLPKGAVSASNIKSGANMLKNDVKNASEYLTTKTPLKNAYRVNPWAFKPNPESYYRMGEGRKFIDDVLETNKIRAYNENSYANLRDAGKISGIREDGKIVLKAKTFPESDTYWSKGVPLDGRYASQNYGNYMIEASNDIPFIHSVNQRTKQKGFWEAPDVNYNSTHSKGTYVKPRQSYGYNIEGNIEPSIGTPLEYNSDLIKLYEPHWLKGYKEVPKQLPGSPNAISRDNVVKAGLDGNFLTRPLTLFTKNEILGSPENILLYRKIGNAKGLQDLIHKGGAQAPAPMRMISGATIDTPFFGPGSKPNENYRGLFAVEIDPANPKYKWSNYVAGTQNKGVAPYNPETGELVKNIPLEDLNVYKKKWFSNNYKKLKPEELKAAFTFAREQALIENLYKWGVRGAVADQIFNDGEYSKAIQNYFSGKSNTSNKKIIDADDKYQKGGIKTHKSKDGTVTNTVTKANGDTIIQVKTKDGKYYEKLIKKSDALDTLSKLQGAVSPEFQALATAKTNTEKQEKKAQQKFLKKAWSDYDKWSTVDKASDRVGAFLNDPFGMTSRALLGEQAYIPGMAQGLHNHEDPEVRNRYLKELGYTPGEFDASDVQNIINPGYWASSFTENSRKGNIGTAALEGALMFLPHLPQGTISRSNIRSGAKMLKNDVAKEYNKVATGNSFLTDMGVPAWKIEKPNQSIFGTGKDLRTYIAKNATDREAELYTKFGQGMHNLTPEDWAEFEALTKSGATDFTKVNTPISRIPLYYNSSEQAWDEARKLLNLKRGQIYKTPSNESIRTWSAGIPKGYSAERIARSKPEQKIRLVIPSRYTKNLGNEFAAMPYHDPKVKFVYNENGTINLNAASENELMGNIPGGFKVIGKSAEDGMNNLIIKPVNNSNLFSNILEKLNIKKGYKKVPKELPDSPNAASEWETTTSNLTKPVEAIPYKPELNTNAAGKLYSLTHERKLLFDTSEGKRRIQNLIDNTPELKEAGFTVDDYKKGLEEMLNVNLYYHNLYKKYDDLEKAIFHASNTPGADQNAIAEMNQQLGKMAIDLQKYEEFIHKPKWDRNAYMYTNRNKKAAVNLEKAPVDFKPDPKHKYEIFASPWFTDADLLRIGRHEIGHYIQRGAKTNLDKELGKITLLENNPNIKPTNYTKGVSEFYNKVMNRENPFERIHKYWRQGSKGQEKLPFIEEVRADLLDEGMINHLYDEVTPEMLEYHYMNYLKKQGNKYPLRIFDIMENTPSNFKIMSDVINNMPAVVPTVIGGTAAATMFGNKKLQKGKMKKGGIIADLTDEEIKEYINEGYIVEEDDDEYQDGGEADILNSIKRKQQEIAAMRAASNVEDEPEEVVYKKPVVETPVQKTIVVNKQPLKPLVKIAVSNKQIQKPKSTEVHKPTVKTFEKSKIKAEQKIQEKQTIEKIQQIKKDLKASYLPNTPKEFYNKFVEKPVVKHVETPKSLHTDTKTYSDELQRMMRAIEEDDMMALVSGTEPKQKPLFEDSNIEKEIMNRQRFDNLHYGEFDKRGDDVMNRTDVKRNRDSELFFADNAKNNSVIIDIGSALGNNDPSMAGVSVWELASNPEIKKKGVNVIATDLPDQVKDFKKHIKNKKAYAIDYAEVPETFNTPIADILKTKKLDDKKDIYLRAANSIDLLMDEKQAMEHLNHIAKTLKNKNVTYLYNNVILFKPEGSKTFKKLGNLNNAAFDHNNRTWIKNKNRIPYTLNF